MKAKPKRKPAPTSKKARSKKNAAPRKAKSLSKLDAWFKRLSPKAQERIRREGYHLPVRSEQEQIENLSEDLQEAWAALRSYLLSLGEQELRTSNKSIMFARKTCYAFARPKKAHIELNFFLLRAQDSEFVKKVTSVSKTKWAHTLLLTHADQLEKPLTDWLREAFDYAG